MYVHCILCFPYCFFSSVFSVALVNREITHVHTYAQAHRHWRTQWISYLGLFAFTSCVMPRVLLSACFALSARAPPSHIATVVRVLDSCLNSCFCVYALMPRTREGRERRVRDSVWKWEDKKIDFFIVTALFLWCTEESWKLSDHLHTDQG